MPKSGPLLATFATLVRMCDAPTRLLPALTRRAILCGLLLTGALLAPQRARAQIDDPELALTRATPSGPRAPTPPRMAAFAEMEGEELDGPDAPAQPELGPLLAAGVSSRPALPPEIRQVEALVQGARQVLMGTADVQGASMRTLASSAVASTDAALPTAASPAKPVVMLDAGHGGEQTGAQGICGVWEKEVTLEVSARVAAILEASDLVVPMQTRTDDTHVPLEARSERANRAGAQLLVSIHANASPYEQAHGIETFFLSLHAASKRLARLAQRENDGQVARKMRSQDPLRRVLEGLHFDANHSASQALAMRLQHSLTAQVAGRGRGVLQAPFRVLMGAQMPATLVEIGFITHPGECARLTSAAGQQFVAQGIAAGILAFVADTQSQSARGSRAQGAQALGLQSLVNAL